MNLNISFRRLVYKDAMKGTFIFWEEMLVGLVGILDIPVCRQISIGYCMLCTILWQSLTEILRQTLVLSYTAISNTVCVFWSSSRVCYFCKLKNLSNLELVDFLVALTFLFVKAFQSDHYFIAYNSVLDYFPPGFINRFSVDSEVQNCTFSLLDEFKYFWAVASNVFFCFFFMSQNILRRLWGYKNCVSSWANRRVPW